MLRLLGLGLDKGIVEAGYLASLSRYHSIPRTTDGSAGWLGTKMDMAFPLTVRLCPRAWDDRTSSTGRAANVSGQTLPGNWFEMSASEPDSRKVCLLCF